MYFFRLCHWDDRIWFRQLETCTRVLPKNCLYCQGSARRETLCIPSSGWEYLWVVRTIGGYTSCSKESIWSPRCSKHTRNNCLQPKYLQLTVESTDLHRRKTNNRYNNGSFIFLKTSYFATKASKLVSEFCRRHCLQITDATVLGRFRIVIFSCACWSLRHIWDGFCDCLHMYCLNRSAYFELLQAKLNVFLYVFQISLLSH